MRPVLVELGVEHAAGRLGSGSDVLGLDDEQSRDHDWGCRLNVLVAPGAIAPVNARVTEQLPAEFRGHPVRFATTWDPRVEHRVQLDTVASFVESRLGIDATTLAPVDWLVLTGQSILEVVDGAVFHDDTGALTAVRARLAWYPDDVWRYVLASAWARLAEELPFVGRTAARGDDVGSRIIAARLARDLMHLAFLIDRRWPPYSKWLGTRLRDLSMGPALVDTLADANERALLEAARLLATAQRARGLPTPDDVVERFWDRPFSTVSESAAAALAETIVDPWLRALPLVGSVEQWSDNVALLSRPERRCVLRAFYEELSRRSR